MFYYISTLIFLLGFMPLPSLIQVHKLYMFQYISHQKFFPRFHVTTKFPKFQYSHIISYLYTKYIYIQNDMAKRMKILHIRSNTVSPYDFANPISCKLNKVSPLFTQKVYLYRNNECFRQKEDQSILMIFFI